MASILPERYRYVSINILYWQFRLFRVSWITELFGFGSGCEITKFESGAGSGSGPKYLLLRCPNGFKFSNNSRYHYYRCHIVNFIKQLILMIWVEHKIQKLDFHIRF
jgi:hypothetical protein